MAEPTPAWRNQGDAIASAPADREAVVELRGDAVRRYTYGELDTAIERAADAVAARRLPAGSRVAILGTNSVPWVIAFYGVMRAGHVAVPISYKMPAEGIGGVLANAQAALLLVEPALRELAEAAASPEVELVDLGALDGAEPGAPRHLRAGGDAAMILYTSGSSGLPKGVELSQESHLWVIRTALARGIDPASRFVVAAPLYHMNALSNVQAALAAGAGVVLLDRFDPRRFLEAVASERGTRVTGVPPMFAMMLAERDLVDSLDLTAVTQVFVGSAPASDALLESIERLFPHGELILGYGTTESGPVAFSPRPGRPTPRGSVGAAAPEVSLRLVGPDGEPSGRRGVLQISCPALMTGYYRRPDIASPITTDGYYHSKDLFEVDDDGYYFFAGREDDMFSSGGENVYPRAVEQVLESHPGVLHAIVVPVADEVKGAKPVAFVVAAPGEHPTEAEVRTHALSQLEPFAHPRRVWFMDAFPLAATNKVDRAALKQRAAELAGGAR